MSSSLARAELKLSYNLRSWAAKAAKLAAGPLAPGSKQVPVPQDPNCLSGLCFVFTGELTAFSRDEAIDLAKRFGAYVFFFICHWSEYVHAILTYPS